MKVSFLRSFLYFVATATHAATAIEPAFNTSFVLKQFAHNGQVMTITAAVGPPIKALHLRLSASYYTIEPVNNPTVCLSYGYGSATNGSTVSRRLVTRYHTATVADCIKFQWDIFHFNQPGAGNSCRQIHILGAALVTEARPR